MTAEQLSFFLSHAILDELDEDGRPLGEHASHAAYNKAGVDERACPYNDRRQLTGKPINVAALRQVSTCWPMVIAQFERIAALHARSQGIDTQDALTGHMVWRVHLAAFAGPALFKLEHPNEPIPRLLSAMFKTSLGYSSIIPSLLLSQPGTASAPLHDVLPEDDFFALSDAQSWLIGQTQVCAGSPSFIKQSYRAMSKRPHHTQAIHPIFERSDLVELSYHLAMTWSRLLSCALHTRELLGHGAGNHLKGYLNVRPDEQDRTSWPVCTRLLHQPNAPQHFALPRAMPGLTQAHISQLFITPPTSSPRPHTLRDIDHHMAQACDSLMPYTHHTKDMDLATFFGLQTSLPSPDITPLKGRD